MCSLKEQIDRDEQWRHRVQAQIKQSQYMIDKMLGEGREEIRAMTKTVVDIKLKKASLSQV